MEDLLPISALQHYAYCPRQFALIHIEQVWKENHFTAEGRILHRRVDSGEPERRGQVCFERGVSVISHKIGIVGKIDLLEIESGNPPRHFPVEYKRGKPKTEDWDRIQLCAQALCLEEMQDIKVAEGAIWYWQTRQRERVCIDSELRCVTLETISAARTVWESGKTPAPTEKKARCRGCSLNNICRPYVFRNDFSKSYIKDLFRK